MASESSPPIEIAPRGDGADGTPPVEAAHEPPPEEIRLEWTYRREESQDIDHTSEMVQHLMNHTMRMQNPTPTPADEVRSHLLSLEGDNDEIRKFRLDLPTVFEKATDPAFVSNPQMREMILMQLKLRELVQGGKVSEDVAKHAVGKLAMDAARKAADPKC